MIISFILGLGRSRLSSAEIRALTENGEFIVQRLIHFSTFQVNPNIAMNLVAQQAPVDCGHERIAVCDGGHPALGHPKVYINLVSS